MDARLSSRPTYQLGMALTSTVCYLAHGCGQGRWRRGHGIPAVAHPARRASQGRRRLRTGYVLAVGRQRQGAVR